MNDQLACVVSVKTSNHEYGVNHLKRVAQVVMNPDGNIKGHLDWPAGFGAITAIEPVSGFYYMKVSIPRDTLPRLWECSDSIHEAYLDVLDPNPPKGIERYNRKMSLFDVMEWYDACIAGVDSYDALCRQTEVGPKDSIWPKPAP
jgi:hypothetical protein